MKSFVQILRRRGRKQVLSGLAVLLLVVVSVAAVLIGPFHVFANAQHVAIPAPANTAVTMYKNDYGLTGQYPNETILNTSNVNTATFGRVASYPVDGQVYAQPLFVPGVNTAQGQFNLVFVATEHDSVYAFDADHTTNTPIWKTSFLINGATSVPATDLYTGAYVDISPEVGITSTPTINISTNTLYVVAMTKESNGTYVHRLHALDITTGNDKVTPVAISATVPGTGDDIDNDGQVTFRSTTENQRSNLVLENGIVYIAFAGYADTRPYHGWIFGYDAATLAKKVVYNDTANGYGGGIWATGGGLSADPGSNALYLAAGNGDFDLNTGGVNAGDTVIKFNTQKGLTRVDYFTPFNQACLNAADKDMGSAGTLLLPPQAGAHRYEMIAGGKEGRIYVLDRQNLGGYTSVTDPCDQQTSTTIDKVVQQLSPDVMADRGMFSTPAYWNRFVYEGGNGHPMYAFMLTNGLLSTAPTSQTPERVLYPGGNPVVSSNGTTAGTGIVWMISPPVDCGSSDHCNPSSGGTLRAYDALNLGNELYSSSQNDARDGLASFVKFSTPTVANGSVFVGTASTLDIFGLNPPAPAGTPTPTNTPGPTPTPPASGVPYNNIGTTDDAAVQPGNFDGSGRSFSAQALAAQSIVPGGAFPNNGAQFIWPGASSGTANNYAAAGQVLPITPVNQAQTLAFLGSADHGPAYGTAVITYTDNTKQPFTLAFSDWTLNGGARPPIVGNQKLATMPYRNTQSGQDNVNTYVFYTDVALLAGKTPQSVTLPSNAHLHVFAYTASANPPVTAPAYNNVGTTDDTKPQLGNFDGGRSYSAQALATAGIAPGNTLTVNGVPFLWPAAPSATANDYSAAGQVIPVTSSGGATTLAFLGAADHGTHSGSIVVTYSDNTQQTFTLAFSDWTLDGGASAPLANNQIAFTMPYRNSSGGRENVTTYVYYTQFTIASGKTVKSVTLPLVAQLHVFTVGTL